ncbi:MULTISPECIES: hypothetical protein [Sphingobium]|uniref:Uncharacterized protein n=1 Tax=Sphingobium baderi TaxID=1332080 RepID=A0A0S3F4I1_9SPHN|nr:MULTISPECIES: hypothetical protein [Sphingobium]ALR22535.1 hypothetical protein ATN00_10420 [Sphingobium baderi]SCW79370.1 hypothetical protein SAMN02927924_02885 [Sphingobium faniae]
MTQGRTLIIVLVALIIGFGAGFVLRPLIAPVEQTAIVAGPPASPVPAEPRGKQYFAAHLDEARQVMAQCAEGTVRGDECFNADMAVTEADAQARHKRFFGK